MLSLAIVPFVTLFREMTHVRVRDRSNGETIYFKYEAYLYKQRDKRDNSACNRRKPAWFQEYDVYRNCPVRERDNDGQSSFGTGQSSARGAVGDTVVVRPPVGYGSFR